MFHIKKILPAILILNLLLFPHKTIALETDSTIPESNNTKVPKRPLPPPRIPPNKVKPGGGLNPYQQSCSNNNKSLIALIPLNSPVLTIEPYPTFLFYIPDIPQDINFAEFSILTADEKVRIYRTQVQLPKTPGIIQVSLPQDSQYQLQSEQLYHWYFTIQCQQDTNYPIVLDVNGWIKRVTDTPKRRLKIESGEPDIWQDTIFYIANNLSQNPQDKKLQQKWFNLLQAIDTENLTKAKLLLIENEDN